MTTNADAIVAFYVKTRDEIEALEALHKEALAPLKERLQKAEGALHKIMQEQSVQSLKTAHGTAYLQEWTKASVVDHDTLFRWAADHNRPDIFPKSCNKTVVLEIGDEVPGVEITRGLKTNVRRR